MPGFCPLNCTYGIPTEQGQDALKITLSGEQMAEEAAEKSAQEKAAEKNAVGTGKVLGSSWTDTLSAELGYGIDGHTELTFFGKTYTFAPVSLDDQDRAAADLELLNTTLLAFGMVKPTESIADISPGDLANMVRVLSGNKEVSEMGACYNVALLFYSITKEQRHAFARLMWYSFRRWHPEITEEQVRSFLDYSNMPVLLRLWFRKNIGVLDRFLSALALFLPPAPEKIEGEMEQLQDGMIDRDYLLPETEAGETVSPIQVTQTEEAPQ